MESKHKAPVHKILTEEERDSELFLDSQLSDEAAEAIYCYRFGPCEKCKAREEKT